MANINTIVDLVHPTVSGVAIPVNDTIWVVFDREVDETSLTSNFFVTGPDQDVWSGPDIAVYKDYASVGSESESLQSPAYHGVVQGTITTERIRNDTYGSYTGYDYTGNGTAYRTKVIFTPTRNLSAETEYTVYLCGDDDTTDTLNTGVCSRTVFDTVKGSNIGTGNASFSGGYTGDYSDIIYVEITTPGDVGTAEFTWYRDIDPALVYGPIHTKQTNVFLADDVYVSFSDGTYVVGDTFQVVVKAPEYFAGNLNWPFETGTGSVQTIPTTTYTSVTGSPSTTVTTATGFEVSLTDPEDQETNIPLPDADYDITVTFSAAVDSATVTTSTISVITEPVNGDVTNPDISYSGVLPITLSTSGSVVTITVASGLLFANNVVTVVLDDSIAGTDGTTLSTDYEWYFTTEYDPLYSSVRKVKLEAGALLTSVPNDTINLAIFEASLEADISTFNSPTSTNEYYNFARRQWVTCKAIEVLLSNVLGANAGLKSKRLADLEVQYDTKMAMNALDKALGCLAKWTPILQAGGWLVQEPTMFIKGEYDPDRPKVGRLWENNDVYQNITPAGNAKAVNTNTNRRYKTGYYSRWGK